MNYGDIITLGRHRLMCGDATKSEDVHALVDGAQVNLVLADPPYGINIVNRRTGQLGSKGRVYVPVIGDTNGDMFRECYRHLRLLCNGIIVWGGQNFTDILPPSCGWLFWDKERNSPSLTFGDGELAWTSCSTRIRKYTQKWNGNIYNGDRSLNERVHPTQKPVELHMKILEDFSQPDDVILDCFGGSGTTLIAAELTGRTCLMMEISPQYCDVIINRYNNLTEGNINFGKSENEG